MLRFYVLKPDWPAILARDRIDRTGSPGSREDAKCELPYNSGSCLPGWTAGAIFRRGDGTCYSGPKGEVSGLRCRAWSRLLCVGHLATTSGWPAASSHLSGTNERRHV